MDLASVKDAFERTCRKQKAGESSTLECVERVLQEVVKAVEKLSVCDADKMENARAVLAELHASLCLIAPIRDISALQKDVSIATLKLGKVLDKSFCTDIAKACREVDWPDESICQIIAVHFYRQGLIELGDCFVGEALGPTGASLKAPFVEMFQIVEGIKMKNLDSALTWARAHHVALMQKGSSLEFELHRLQFLQLLLKGLRPEALQYARNNFGPFSVLHMAEIQRLMCCLLWTGRLEMCPYSDLFSASRWEEMAQRFTRECCSLLGQSYESPLNVTLAAGAQALPTLLKMATVLTSKKQEWQLLKQLPVEIELSKEFQFHSIFACPVSKDQSTAENPPMLMPCCHVLCKQSLQKLAKNRSFKCPYCPAEVTMSQCRPIYF
ncbi:hypothetical protein L7F22_036315 [Adiantum nelumboides]|nr:hypothetical protein [Adiantum nelumboides]